MANEEVKDFWKWYKDEQKVRREERVPVRQEAILSLRKEGFKIVKKTYNHYRVNDRLDIWITHNRFHDIRLNRRGGFKEVKSFVRRFFQ